MKTTKLMKILGGWGQFSPLISAIVALGVSFGAFAEDAYVASTGAQAINTGYRVNSKTKIEIDFKLDALNRSTEIFGASGSSGTTCCLWINGNGNLEPNFGGWCGGIEGPAKAERRTVVFDMPDKTVKIYAHGGTTPLNTKGSDKVFDKGEANFPLALFANCKDANGSAVENFGTCRIYSFKVREGADLIHDWQPAMKGGEVGFVDKVDGSFISEHRFGATPLTIGGDYETLDEDPYIESDGTSVINTGIVPDTDLRFEVDYAMTDTTVQQRIIGNNMSNGSNQTVELYINGNGVMSYAVLKGQSATASANTADLKRHTFVADMAENKVCFITGNTTNNTSTANSSSPIDGKGTVPIALFGRIISANGSSDWAGGRAKARIYGVKCYKGTTLVRNLVPCIKGDVPGFRDTVGGTFHTGEFNVQGLSASDNAERIKDDGYIELVGNNDTVGGHYIDTDYKPGPETRLELDYAISSNLVGHTDWYILGAGVIQNGNAMAHYASKTALGNCLGKVSSWVGTGMPAPTNTAFARRTIILDAPNMAATLVTAGYVNYASTNNNGFAAFTGNTSSTLKIGSVQSGNGGYTPMRIYGLKIYENDTLKYDYKPKIVNGAPVLVSGSSTLKVSWRAKNDNGSAGIPVAGGDIAVSSESDRDAFVLFTGSQSLDTGYKANGKTKFVVDFSFANGYNVPQQFVFNTGETAGQIIGRIYTSASGGNDAKYAWNFFNAGKWPGTGVAVDHQRRLITIDALNGQMRMTPGATDDSTINQDSLFSNQHDGVCTATTKIGSNVSGTDNFARMRLYRLTIYDNGTKVREYVPAVVGGVAGLRDLVHPESALLTATGLTVSGRGHDGAEEWMIEPQSAVTLTKDGGSTTLKALAIGAQSYKWTKNDEAIEGGEHGELTVSWEKRSTDNTVDTYTVTPVYNVFGTEVDGEPKTIEVTNAPLGMMVILR